jgi:hypothetical protein
MVVFRGRMRAPFDSNVNIIGPGNFWDDFDDGEVWNQDISVAGFSSDSVYVVMLVERDSGNDIDANDLGTWRNITGGTWKVTRGSQTLAGLPDNEAQRNAAANAIVNSFSTARNATTIPPEDPDDKIGKPRRLVISPGANLPMIFAESPPDGLYSVQFKIK